MQLRILESGKESRIMPLKRLVTTLGLGIECDISFSPTEKTKRVGMFIREDGRYMFRPLVGEKDLSLDGVPLTESTVVNPGQVIRYGKWSAVFEEEGAEDDPGIREFSVQPETETPKEPAPEDSPEEKTQEADKGENPTPHAFTPRPLPSASRIGRVGALQAYLNSVGISERAEVSAGKKQTKKDEKTEPEPSLPADSVPETEVFTPSSPAGNHDEVSSDGLTETGVDLDAARGLSLIKMQEEDKTPASLSSADLRQVCGESLVDLGLDPTSGEYLRSLDTLEKELTGYGPLESLLNQRQVREIRVLSPRTILINNGEGPEDSGRSFADRDELARICERIAGCSKGELPPVVESVFRGFRTIISTPPGGAEEPFLRFERSTLPPENLSDLSRRGLLNDEMVEFFKLAVATRQNILLLSSCPGMISEALSALCGHLPVSGVSLRYGVPSSAPAHGRVVQLKPDKAGMEEFFAGALRAGAGHAVLNGFSAVETLDWMRRWGGGIIAGLSLADNTDPIRAVELELTLGSKAIDPSTAGILLARSSAIVVNLGRDRTGERRIKSVSELAESAEGSWFKKSLFAFRENESDPAKMFQRVGEAPEFIRRHRENNPSDSFNSFRETDA